MLRTLSAFWARCELSCAALCACAVTLLILLNVLTRALGMALFWVDELAIYAMVWMTFLGTSAALHYGHSIAITILTDMLPVPIRYIMAKLVDVIILIFAVAMIWFCWRWFSPLELIAYGFDIEQFQENSFNFIYAEPTSTIGIKKYLVWSIMWLFALGASLHSVANLFDMSRTGSTQTHPLANLSAESKTS